MERAPIGPDAILSDAGQPEAANDPVIEGSKPARGWDPFEVWRTRVRDMRNPRPKDGDESPG